MAQYLQLRASPKKNHTMHSFIRNAAALMVALSVGFSAAAQDKGCDVFLPIAKYLGQGDAESLSAWFAYNLEVTVPDGTSDSSRNQAKQILKSFFSKSSPTGFTIEHTASRGNMKYALGALNCGAENYVVTIFVSFSDKMEGYRVQQLKIEKSR